MGPILPLVGLAMPFGVFWMTGHFLSVPLELSEAARMDGASTLQLFGTYTSHSPYPCS
jgi:raffinose/stachyose/melibiose transport system permease protein